MTQVSTNCQGGEESLERSSEAHVPTLFEKETVHVSEIVGDLTEMPSSAEATPASMCEEPKRMRLGLRLDWYDCGVVALIVASLAVAIVCLLHGG